MTYFSAGEQLTAAKLEALLPIFVRKTADQDYTSTTITNDTHLVTPTLVANATYWGKLVAYYSASQANDGFMDMTFPSGAMTLGGTSVPATTITATNGSAEFSAVVNDTSSPIDNPESTSDWPFGGRGSAALGNPLAAEWTFILRTTATGTLQVRFRKVANTDAAVATRIHQDSHLILWRILA